MEAHPIYCGEASCETQDRADGREEEVVRFAATALADQWRTRLNGAGSRRISVA